MNPIYVPKYWPLVAHMYLKSKYIRNICDTSFHNKLVFATKKYLVLYLYLKVFQIYFSVFFSSI